MYKGNEWKNPRYRSKIVIGEEPENIKEANLEADFIWALCYVYPGLTPASVKTLMEMTQMLMYDDVFQCLASLVAEDQETYLWFCQKRVINTAINSSSLFTEMVAIVRNEVWLEDILIDIDAAEKCSPLGMQDVVRLIKQLVTIGEDAAMKYTVKSNGDMKTMVDNFGK